MVQEIVQGMVLGNGLVIGSVKCSVMGLNLVFEMG